jgi:NAD(P)-dependent dehydrogenase (short-subunit alcohol dehydrogenase family)
VTPDHRRRFDLTGKTAVVLGAESGIGKAAAEALASLGADVMCADSASEGAEATAAGIRERGGLAEAAICDAADASDIAALATSAILKFSRLDIAVATPERKTPQAILKCCEDDLDRAVNSNLEGTEGFFRAFGRFMKKQQGGSIIACSAVRGATTEPELAVCGSTKATIDALVTDFASEVSRCGIRVNAIALRISETASTRPIAERLEEVATAVTYLASDAASHVSGSTLFVDRDWNGTDRLLAGYTEFAIRPDPGDYSMPPIKPAETRSGR